MYMLIRYAGGIIVEGVLLARGRDRLRVAAAGFPETIELRRSGSRWITSGHVQVEFDFLLTCRMNTRPRALTLKGYRYGPGGLKFIGAVRYASPLSKTPLAAIASRTVRATAERSPASHGGSASHSTSTSPARLTARSRSSASGNANCSPTNAVAKRPPRISPRVSNLRSTTNMSRQAGASVSRAAISRNTTPHRCSSWRAKRRHTPSSRPRHDAAAPTARARIWDVRSGYGPGHSACADRSTLASSRSRPP